MDSSERLKVAGDAAVLIEEMGLGITAVARLSDGVVTLECWGASSSRHYVLRQVVTDPPGTASALAERCVAEMRAAIAKEGGVS
jgi:hypothetical protein